MNKFLYVILAVQQFSFSAAFAEDQKKLVVDKAHSKIAFVAEAAFVDAPLGYTAEGTFSDFDGQAQFSKQDFSDLKIYFKVQINSLKTKTLEIKNNLEGTMTKALGEVTIQSIAAMDSMRDSHLKEADYFDVANYPEASFKSISVSPGANASDYVLRGIMNIHGIKPAKDLVLKPIKQYQDGQNRKHFVFEATTNLSRDEFGIGVVGSTPGQVNLLGHVLKIKDEVITNVVLDMVEVAP